MSDSGAIDAALVALLLADTGPGGLATLLPDGVFIDVANPNAKRFVIVSVLFAADEPIFGRRGYEDVLYLVKAVASTKTGANVRAAAQRIDDLLEDCTLTIPGYTHMVTCREERVRTTEVDEADPAIRWQHWGGHYRVQAAPN